MSHQHPTNNWICRSLAIAIVVFLQISRLAAAEIIIEPPNSECSILLSGTISVGDSDKLKDSLLGYYEHWRSLNGRAPSEVGKRGRNDVLLCLSSNGGNLEEAFDMALQVYQNNWVTRIQPNESCLSACAIIFMAGNRKWRSGRVPAKDRQISTTAVLGFHSPKPPSFEGQVDTSEAYDAALDQIGRSLLGIANLGTGYWLTPLMKPSLVNQLALTSHTKLFIIDTIGKAAENEISIVGIDDKLLVMESIKVDEGAAFNICFNATAARYSLDYAESVLRHAIEYISGETTEHGSFKVTVRFHQGSRLRNCEINFYSQDQVQVDFPSQEISQNVPLWFALAPSASLNGRDSSVPRAAGLLDVCANAAQGAASSREKGYCDYFEMFKLETEWRLLRDGRLSRKGLGGRSNWKFELSPNYTLEAENNWRRSMAACQGEFVCLWNGYGDWLFRMRR